MGTLEKRFSGGERPYVWLANRISRRGFVSWVGKTAIAASTAGALSAMVSREVTAAVNCGCNCINSTGGPSQCTDNCHSCNFCKGKPPLTAYCSWCNPSTCSSLGGYWYTCNTTPGSAIGFRDCCAPSTCQCNLTGCSNKPTCCYKGYGCNCSRPPDWNCNTANCMGPINRCVISFQDNCVSCGNPC